jgi:hypothetical protein
MDSTFTPIVAQSSVDASLMSMETLPVCALGIEGDRGALPPEPPPPQAAINAVATPNDNNRVDLGSMMNVSSFNEIFPALVVP